MVSPRQMLRDVAREAPAGDLVRAVAEELRHRGHRREADDLWKVASALDARAAQQRADDHPSLFSAPVRRGGS